MSRVRIEFWLDRTDDSDVELLEYIQCLKDNREFITTMRRALRLVGTLDVSNTEELLKQYPWIVDVLKCSDDDSDILKRFNELKELIMNNPQIPAAPMVASPVQDSGGIKKLAGFDKIKAPVIDDDDNLPILKKDMNAGSNASDDFMKSINALLH